MLITKENSQLLMEWIQLSRKIEKVFILPGMQRTAYEAEVASEFRMFPKILFENNSLRIDGFMISLLGRPRTAQLVRAFYSKNDQFLSKDELLKLVYNLPDEASLRLRDSRSQDILKLISRSRRLLNQSCNGENISPQIDWLPFDKELNGWRLFRFIPREIIL